MKTPYDKLAKIYTNCSGHMTKMADIPIYDKNPLKIFSRTRRLLTLGCGMYYLGCRAYQVFSNDDLWLTLIYLTSRSILLPNTFKLEKY